MADSFSLASYMITKKLADQYIVAFRILAIQSLIRGHRKEGIAAYNNRVSFVKNNKVMLCCLVWIGQSHC